MKIFKVIFYIILIGLSSELYAQTTYYVDFENGSDTNNGTKETTAWKHAPGDENAVDVPSNVELLAGDIILFRGGVVYKGSIRISADGEADNPITYKGDGWGSEKAIIDGSEPIINWQACNSAADVRGNPNWQNIYYADIPETVPWSAVNLQEEGDFLWIAQEPNMPDPFFHDEVECFYEVPSTQMDITSLTDPLRFNQTDPNTWDGSSVLLWTLPNIVVLREIKSFDPAENRITYEETNDPTNYNKYSIYNSIHVLDSPGEYYTDPTANDGTRRVYLWPRNTSNLNNNQITYSIRKYGFNIADKNHIVIEGFEIRAISGDLLRDGIAIGSYNLAYIDKTGITVRNNYIHHNMHETGGYGGIYFSNCNECLIENNIIRENKDLPGIFSTGCDYLTVQNNQTTKAGATSMRFYTCENLKVIRNTVIDGRGTHANGLTFYLSCNNVLVDGNKVLNSNICLTYQESSNLTFINNIFDGYDNTDYVSASWSSNSGYVNFFNNTIIGSNSDYAFLYNPSANSAVWNIKNNILDGGGRSNAYHTHNLYLSESWNQESMGEGEFLETDTDLIFEDLANGNYNISENSPAKDAGTNTSSYMPLSSFGGHVFNQDIAGTLRPQGEGWDIGAYEYNEGDIPENNSDIINFIGIFPNPVEIRARISFILRNAGNCKIDIFNFNGQIIKHLLNEDLPEGYREVYWNGTNNTGDNVANGSYILKISTTGYSKVVKIVVMK
ncbi:MAG: T9SS type A sorting domain-containing protein [bacterium]|nr:T9SS type A sorting domain-containing protein [bacterium]